MLWEGETLPLAAALQMKRGAVLYRDVWFDKPPLVPAVYLLWGAATGAPLRMAGAVFDLLACLLAYAAGTTLWTRREGYLAAALLAFFLIFDTHSGVVPLAADSLLLVPHLAAILLALRRQAFWSGVAAGVGFLFNAKAVFVLAACALFAWPAAIPLAAGFALPNIIALAWLAGAGALGPWIDQAWRWPAQYAASPVVSNPVANGIVRTLNWLGFHAVLAIGFALYWWRERNWKFLAWAALSYAGVVLGWRFFPRYFFLLLPVLVLAAARGLVPPMWGNLQLAAAFRRLSGPVDDPRLQGTGAARLRVLAVLALLTMAVPLVRFGPRYLALPGWSDLSMDGDSRAASSLVLSLARPGATLYVWGYRPEIFVYTGLKPATKYLECQALTGVPADRHLTQSTAVLTQGTREAREELARARPDILIDGLTLFNPALGMSRYPELRPWLAQYHEVARTPETVIYTRNDYNRKGDSF